MTVLVGSPTASLSGAPLLSLPPKLCGGCRIPAAERGPFAVPDQEEIKSSADSRDGDGAGDVHLCKRGFARGFSVLSCPRVPCRKAACTASRYSLARWSCAGSRKIQTVWIVIDFARSCSLPHALGIPPCAEIELNIRPCAGWPVRLPLAAREKGGKCFMVLGDDVGMGSNRLAA